MPQVSCPGCHASTTLSAERLADLLESMAQGAAIVVSADGEARFSQADHHPCAACGATVPLGTIPLGEASSTPCPKCGATLEAFPPPPWIARELPGLLHFYGAAREPTAAPPRSWSMAFKPPLETRTRLERNARAEADRVGRERLQYETEASEAARQKAQQALAAASRTDASIDLVSKIFIGLALLALGIYIVGGLLGFWKDPTL